MQQSNKAPLMSSHGLTAAVEEPPSLTLPTVADTRAGSIFVLVFHWWLEKLPSRWRSER